MYGGPPPGAPWARPGAGPGQGHEAASASPGPSNSAGSPYPQYAGPPPSLQQPMPHSQRFHSPSPGPSNYGGAPPGFVAGRPPPGGYSGPPPTSSAGAGAPYQHYSGPPPPNGPAGMPFQQHVPYPLGPPSMGGPGLGMPGAPQAAAPAPAAPIAGVAAHTTVFVGTISGGVGDTWLRKLFDAVGALRSFKRVNASFGFAEFVDADSVLRALAVLPGLELPSMGKDSGNPASRKKLTVKADEKTRKYLDQYEQERIQTQGDNNAESAARERLQDIVTQMSDPNNVDVSDASTTGPAIPQHLKDLPPEELPEEHRGAVLSEIEKFRQASAARDEERRRKERIQDMERMRASERSQQQMHQRRGSEDAHASSGPSQTNGRWPSGDPQSYSRPVSFVPGGSGAQRVDEETLQPDERDAREEERRLQRQQEDKAHAAHEAERRYQAQERARLAHWDQELGREEEELARRHRFATQQRRRLEEWDQARESERELFYHDRSRWRAQRKQQREREEREDEADRQSQVQEEERARVETERFLAQQAEDMAAFEREQRAAGVLMPSAGGEHAPLKLKRMLQADGGEAANVGSSGIAQSQQTTQPRSILGTMEDDSELSGIRRGKLGHIDLSDPNDIGSQREKVRRGLASDHQSLFEKIPEWNKLPKDAIDTRYREVVDKGIIESIGESVPDMVDELLGKVRAHASAADLVDVVEPVLEDDAAPLVAALWIEILVDTLAGATEA